MQHSGPSIYLPAPPSPTLPARASLCPSPAPPLDTPSRRAEANTHTLGTLGRRDSAQRPRSQPRIPSDCRPRLAHQQSCRAAAREFSPRHRREADGLSTNHLWHWRRPPGCPLPGQVLQDPGREPHRLCQQPDLGEPPPDLHQCRPADRQLPVLQQGDQGSGF